MERKVWDSYSEGEYDKMISQSKIMKNEIIDLITERGGNPDEESSSFSGSLHRTWIPLKNPIPKSNNDKQTLENVVFG
ncbi:hypothetical protein J2799_000180 [Chryseobacterium vietnamense]|uniref:hypothetical protein n=1 Tax=Chryseobacterium vietnamense TaxID=866785 RepID=UPI00285CD5D4|nr:hypothetical protein [Chryseobacterium vietnamense]MDR6485695.1 hypothetical protein [Chryseobacterium vietnamense]